MTTPIYDLTEWAAAQSAPWVPHNAALRALEAVGRGSVLDRDENDPPGACADGACYLIAAAATGAWTGHEGKMAVAVGTNAANGWIVLTIATEGQILWVEDEAIRIQYVSAAWSEIALGGAAVETIVEGDGILVDATDPANPIVGVDPDFVSSIGGGVSNYVTAPAWRVRTLTAGSGGSDLAAWGEIEFLDVAGTLIDPTGGTALDSATEAGFDGTEAFDGIVTAGNGYKHQELAGSAVDSWCGNEYTDDVAPVSVRLTPIPGMEDEAPESFAIDYSFNLGVWFTLTTASTSWPTDDDQTFDLYSEAAFVQKSGDTMTGPLILAADPTEELEAATKQYVDDETAGLFAVQEWAPNFTDDGDLYIPADVAMTISQGNATIGTGTLDYEQSTAADPDDFTSTSLPATLEAGAWLKVAATSVTGFVATHLVRTA